MKIKFQFRPRTVKLVEKKKKKEKKQKVLYFPHFTSTSLTLQFCFCPSGETYPWPIFQVVIFFILDHPWLFFAIRSSSDNKKLLMK